MSGSGVLRDVERYDLWYIPEFPMAYPWVRDRDAGEPWRLAMLESIKSEGLRYPLVVFGHTPKAKICEHMITDANKDRDFDYYVHAGTNRYWCLQQLGYETFPAVLSINTGSIPKWDGTKITPQEYIQYCPANSEPYVQEHGFGYSLAVLPEEEFG